MSSKLPKLEIYGYEVCYVIFLLVYVTSRLDILTYGGNTLRERLKSSSQSLIRLEETSPTPAEVDNFIKTFSETGVKSMKRLLVLLWITQASLVIEGLLAFMAFSVIVV